MKIPFYDAYLTDVIRPRVREVAGLGGITSIESFRQLFNKTYDTTVSYETFRGWLESLDIKLSRTVQVTGPTGPPPPTVPRPASLESGDLPTERPKYRRLRQGEPVAGPGGQRGGIADLFGG